MYARELRVGEYYAVARSRYARNGVAYGGFTSEIGKAILLRAGVLLSTNAKRHKGVIVQYEGEGSAVVTSSIAIKGRWDEYAAKQKVLNDGDKIDIEVPGPAPVEAEPTGMKDIVQISAYFNFDTNRPGCFALVRGGGVAQYDGTGWSLIGKP